MQMKAAFNVVVRPLSALSFVVAMLGVLAVASASALAAGDANEAACPNEASSGFRAYLPDCRAYELVSPVFKDGTFLESSAGSDVVSGDGSHMIDTSLGAFAGTESDPKNIANGAVYEALTYSLGLDHLTA